MKRRSFGLCVVLLALSTPPALPQAQNPASARGGSRDVIAVIDGKEYTVGDVRRLRSYLPPALQPQVARMTHREFLGVLRNLMGVAKAAEAEGVLEKEPFRSQYEFTRWNFLANAYASELARTIKVPEEELKQFYEKNKERYGSVRVSAIYINYTPDAGGAPAADGKERLTEQQAKAKAEQLIVALGKGADFAEMAKQHSDDKSSAEKGGDLGTFNKDSSIPDAIKGAVLRLKAGEVSEPVRDGGRYYIFKATAIEARPFQEVRSQIEPHLRSVKLLTETRKAQGSVSLEFSDHPALDESPEGSQPSGLSPLGK